jgi:hypothetical protein
MKETTTTRELLDCLGRSTLVRLIYQRGLAPSRENDERRKTLAHSYRGDVEGLVGDLNRQDLITLFRQLTFVVGHEEVYLSNPAKFRLEELRAFAIRGFVGRRVRIPEDFSPASALDDDEDELDGDDRDDEPIVDDSEAETDGDDEGRAGHADVLGDLADVWSRPRLISRVMHLHGWEVPQRLRTGRFQELLEHLRSIGVEACLADDPDAAVLDQHAESPGIAAKLRLRRASAHARQPVHRGAQAAAPRADGGPPIVIQPGERPVSQRIPRPTDYNLAVLKLQFLTAVPSVERRGMPEWPAAYLEAATRGLQLRQQETTLLPKYAAGLSIGNHSPYDAIPQLAQVLGANEWEQLLEDFVRLNPFQPELVQAIVQQIEPITAPRSEAQTWRDAVPPPADLRESRGPSERPASEPLAASSRRPSSASQAPAKPATNVRDLGAIPDMFEDE